MSWIFYLLAMILTAQPEASMEGYSRDLFPHWERTDKTCDVRDTVLQRDASSVKMVFCGVYDGVWYSSYDGKTLTSTSDVDIDHIVPLAEAWRSGANRWSLEKRTQFANDPENLKAVSDTSNRAKGDQDIAKWLPLEDKCEYVAQWHSIKRKYGLSFNLEELGVKC